ncbi:MAG: choice-of-anchor D domain-containing protein [Chloroflexota bacterium]
MRKFLFSFCFALMALFLASNEPAQATAKKRVFLEQYTGAWCGYCVDGTVKMDDILAAKPDQVIGVKLHGGDPMEIPVFAEVDNLVGITGFPMGSVDRIVFNAGGQPTIGLDRGSWAQAVDIALQTAAVVDLKATYIPLGGNDYTINVIAKFDSKPTKEMRLNFYVVEDDVTGSSAAYNQSNYYDKTSGHPYYGKGNPIVGYKHQAVVRMIGGGALGFEGSLPDISDIEVGQTYSFSRKITLDPNWNKSKIKFIGMAQFNSSNPFDVHIDNVVYATQEVLKSEVTGTNDGLFVLGNDENHIISATIKNTTNLPIDYKVQAQKLAGTPSDWTATFDITETTFRLQGKESKTVQLTIDPGTTPGIGGYSIITKEVDNAESALPSVMATIVSKEISSLYVNDDAGVNSILPAMQKAGYTKFVEVKSSTVAKINTTLPQLKNLVWDAAATGKVSSEEATFISKYINRDANVGIFACGAMHLSKSELSSVFVDFGVSYVNAITQGKTTALIGYSNDPITDSFDQPIQLISYLLPGFAITNPSKTTPILRVKAVDSVVAVKTQWDNSRGLLVGITPAIITNVSARESFIKKAMDWLIPAAPKPVVSLSVTTLDYGKVKLNTPSIKTVEIENKGAADLVIQSMTFTTAGVFELNTAETFPKTIVPGAKFVAEVKFTPTEAKKYNANLAIVTNDPVKPNSAVSLWGEGENTGVWEENLRGVSLTVTPNPATTEAKATIILPENVNAKLYVINSAGARVLNVSDAVSNGVSVLPINLNELNSGSYFLVLDVRGSLLKTTLNVIR